MKWYVNIAKMSDETLETLGYVLVDESPTSKIYRHFGEDIIVDKADPFIYVDDPNDVQYFGTEALSIPDGPDDR